MSLLRTFTVTVTVLACILPSLSSAQETSLKKKVKALQNIELPAPQKTGGKTLLDVIASRKTSREFSQKEMPIQVLSDLLWAAYGINRADKTGRTAPSARNTQEIDIYVSLKTGLYLYEPLKSVLTMVSNKDIRASTGKQEFVGSAPVNLIYVSDYTRMESIDEEHRVFYSGVTVGHISQNVYLFCASEGLGTVVRGLVDRESLGEMMNLNENQHIVLAQTVGYLK